MRCYLSSHAFYEGINNKGGRSAQAGFNQSDIALLEADFPIDEVIVQKFENTVCSMFEQRLQLRKENQRLASLRDTLLPKLMSASLMSQTLTLSKLLFIYYHNSCGWQELINGNPPPNVLNQKEK